MKIWPTLNSAASAEKNIRLLIEHQCPQCGAPAELEETDRLFHCQYCRVKSYLLNKGYFQYCLPSKAPANKELIHFPYWRLKGMYFECRQAGVQERFIDISHQALKTRQFPVSLGLRSQALKLRFVTPAVAGQFIKPLTTPQHIIERADLKRHFKAQGECYHQTYIGEAYSLIYAPHYLDRHLIDAVLNQPVSPATTAEAFQQNPFDVAAAQKHIDFIPTLCPHCGWDMHGEKSAQVLTCANCQTAWFAGSRGFRQMRFATLGKQPNDVVYLPFWRVRAHIEGIELDTEADLVKRANLPKVANDAMDQRPFCFWSPAFKVRPKVFLRLAQGLTLIQPEGQLRSQLPTADTHPVTLPFSEAIESLKLLLAQFVKPRRDFLPRLPQINIHPQKLLLIFLPFRRGHHDLVFEGHQLALNKNVLNLSRHL